MYRPQRSEDSRYAAKASVVELVYTADLKSAAARIEGS